MPPWLHNIRNAASGGVDEREPCHHGETGERRRLPGVATAAIGTCEAGATGAPIPVIVAVGAPVPAAVTGARTPAAHAAICSAVIGCAIGTECGRAGGAYA